MNAAQVKKIMEDYNKLKAQSDYCREKGINPEKCDGICMFRTIEEYLPKMEVSLLLIIKMLYVTGYSIRKCARESGYCEKTVIRKRDLAITEIREILELKKLSTLCP